jgi:hypothetical protein
MKWLVSNTNPVFLLTYPLTKVAAKTTVGGAGVSSGLKDQRKMTRLR